MFVTVVGHNMPNDSKHIRYSFLTIPTNTVYVIVLTWSDLQIWHFASRASARDNKEIDVSLIHPELITHTEASSKIL